MSEMEARHYIGAGGGRARGARVGARDARGDGRPEVLRPARHVAARDAADQRLRRVGVRRRARVRRLLDPRLAGDLRERHAADARRLERHPRPGDRGADALAHLRDRRPAHARAVRRRIRAASRSAPRRTCARAGSPTRPTSAPSASSSSSTRCRTSSARTARTTSSTRPRGTGTRASRGSATPCARRRATSRRRRTTRCSDLRTQMVLTLERLGIPCEFHHHEVASGGQCEIDLRFQTLTRMADQVMIYKYVVKNVAHAAGKTVTFMPKPIFGDNGSGMHTHQSLWMEGTPLMADKSGLRGPVAAGARRTSPACSRTRRRCSRSARRRRTRTAGSCPGYEAPVNLVYSQRNRSACIRIPMYSESPKAKRVEFRCPDAAANPYLAFAAMLMAGLDGIERGLDAGAPADFDLFEESHDDVPQVPGSLAEALDALEADHEFLTKGGVFSEELIRDVDRLQARERGRRRAAPPASRRVRPVLRLLATAHRACVIRDLRADDWTAVAAIYDDGMRSGNATFETEVPSWEAWDAAHPSPGRRGARRARRRLGGASAPRRRAATRRRRGERLRRTRPAGPRDRARAAGPS